MQEAYYTICSDAADLANADTRLRDKFGDLGQFFTPATEGDVLALDYSTYNFINAVRAKGLDQREMEDLLADIVQDALYNAIIGQPDMFGGLVLDHLRGFTS